MFCSRCGQELKDGTNFCTRCGHRQGTTVMTAEKAAPEETKAQNEAGEAAEKNSAETPGANEAATGTPGADENAAKIVREQRSEEALGDCFEHTAELEEKEISAETASEEKASEETASDDKVESGAGAEDAGSDNTAEPETVGTTGVHFGAEELARAGSAAAEEIERKAREEAAAAAVAVQPPTETAVPQAAPAQEKKEGKGNAILPIVIGVILAVAVLGILCVILVPKLIGDDGRKRNREREEEEIEEEEEIAEEEEEIEEEPVPCSLEISAIDEEGYGLEEVTVEIISGDSVIELLTTDINGDALTELLPGAYSVRFSKDGYVEDYSNVVIPEGETGEYGVIGELIPVPMEVEIIAQPASARDGLEGILVSVYDDNGEEIAAAETDEKSRVEFELTCGDYKIVYHCDGFFDEINYITVDGNMSIRQLLVPKMADETALDETVFVLLEWNGDYDLDVCLFNAASKEYVCARTPMDEYNNFIYSDNNGTQGYELLCLRNRYKEAAQTVYVVDALNAPAWEYSPMEADGFTLKIYTVDGVDIVEPQEEQNSPAWAAFYYEDGSRHELNQYIYEETALEWTKDIKPEE